MQFFEATYFRCCLSRTRRGPFCSGVIGAFLGSDLAGPVLPDLVAVALGFRGAAAADLEDVFSAPSPVRDAKVCCRVVKSEASISA